MSFTVSDLEDLQRLTSDLRDHLRRLTENIARLDDGLLKLHYARKVAGAFGDWLWEAQSVDPDELWDRLEPHLGHEDTGDALLADVLVRGRVARLPERPEAYLIVEISAVIDDHDVERAIRRTELFRRAGYSAIPAVAGREATGAAKALAEGRGVAMLQDGQESYWDEALRHWPVA